MKSVRVVLWAGVALAVGLAAESAFYGFRDAEEWVPDLLTGWTLVGCGLVAWHGRPYRRVGPLLMATGLLWFVPSFDTSQLAALAWVAERSLYLHRGPLVQVIVTYPAGSARSRLERVAVAGGYAAAVVEPVWGDERWAIILGVTLIVVAARLHARSVGRERRARLTALWVAVAVGSVIAGGAAARLIFFPSDVADDVSLLGYEVVLCAAGLVLAGGVLSRSHERADVADLVVELGEERSDRLRDGLARALGDPSLVVGYWLSETDEYVDSSGRPLPMPDDASGRATTFIGATSNPIGILIHHPSVLDDPGLVESIATATRLASVNARLQAEVRARIVELEASRRRIVTVSDEQHGHLERRLRDGAERRLDDLAHELHRARRTADDATIGPIEHVAAQLAETLDELRTLAAGLHPREITERGLVGALEALAARIGTDTQLTVTGVRLPAALEAAVYFVCAEALTNVDKHASASSASVAVTIADRVVRIDVRDDGVGGANPAAGTGLVNLADRVHALGGTLDVVCPHSGGTCLVAELPLGDTVW